MSWLRQFLFKFTALFRRRQLEQEMAEEMRLHLEDRVRRNVKAGMEPGEARFAAQREFGGVEQAKEQVRDERNWVWLEQFWQDLRYSTRALRRNPIFTTTAVVTLGLGIGVNAVLFMMYNTMFLRTFPSRDTDELVLVRNPRFSFADYLDYRDGNSVFSSLTAFPSDRAQLVYGEGLDEQPDPRFDARRPGTVFVQAVATNYFSVLGVEMELGRAFAPEDATDPATAGVIVLSGAFWEYRLQSDPNIVGKTIRIGGTPRTVIGVAAREFVGLSPAPPAGWLPMGEPADPKIARFNAGLMMIGRLKPGVTQVEAKTNLDVIARRIWDAHPREGRPFAAVEVAPAMRWMNPPRDAKFLAAVSTIGLLFLLVLVIACTNVANVLLARGVMRQPEIGVRLTLGASRGRMLRQLLTENLLLCSLGGVVGLVLAFWTLQLGRPIVLSQFGPDEREMVRMWESASFAPDWRIFGGLLVLVLLAGLAAGLAPAVHASQANLISTLKGEGSAFGRRLTISRLRNLLVIAQVSVCLVLLGVAVVFMRNSHRLLNADLGFQFRPVVEMWIQPDRELRDVTELAAWYDDTTTSLQTVPGVASVSAGVGSLFNPIGRTLRATFESGDPIFLEWSSACYVTSGFFATYQIPIRKGRGLDPSEINRGARVVVLSERAAQQLWPGQDPIGRTVGISNAARGATPGSFVDHTVIGVTGRVTNEVGNPSEGWAFLPLQPINGRWALSLRLESQTDGALAAVVGAAERRGLRVIETRWVAAEFEHKLLPYRWLSYLGSTLGGLALAMASVGLYGVVAFSVNSRVREIGIRLALGATTRRVLSLFLRQGLRSVAIGIAIGLVGGGLFSLLLSKVRFGISPAFDLAAFAVATAILTGVAMLACYLPASRAAKVDPMVALRTE